MPTTIYFFRDLRQFALSNASCQKEFKQAKKTLIQKTAQTGMTADVNSSFYWCAKATKDYNKNIFDPYLHNDNVSRRFHTLFILLSHDDRSYGYQIKSVLKRLVLDAQKTLQKSSHKHPNRNCLQQGPSLVYPGRGPGCNV